MLFRSALLLFVSIPGLASAFATATSAATTQEEEDKIPEGASRELAAALRNFDISSQVASPIREKIHARFSDSITKHFGNALHATDIALPLPSSRRNLAAHVMNDTCVPAIQYADDDDSLTKFGDEYKPMCMCEGEGLDPAEQFQNLPTPDATQISEFLNTVNDILNNVDYTESVTCINGCNSCFDEYCGILEYYETLRIQAGLNALLTLAELAGFALQDPEPTEEQWALFFFSRVQIKAITGQDGSCLDLTTGGTEKICWQLNYNLIDPNITSVEFDESMLFAPGVLSCEGSADGVACNTCEIYFTEDFEECVRMDCTNLVPNANIDTCVGEESDGFLGPLEAYYLIEVAEDSANTTVGDCPTMAPTEATPTKAPTEAMPTKAPTTAVPGEPTTTQPVTLAPDSGAFYVSALGWTALAAAALVWH